MLPKWSALIMDLLKMLLTVTVFNTQKSHDPNSKGIAVAKTLNQMLCKQNS